MFDSPFDRRSRTLLRRSVMAMIFIACSGAIAYAQPAGANYDEARVGRFVPLDPLTTSDGRRVTTPDLWTQVRRPELLRMFETEMYGKVPQSPEPTRPMVRLRSEDRNALDGKAIRREVTIAFTENLDGPRMDLLIYLPRDAGPSRRAPAFLALNFGGNHTVHADPGIMLARGGRARPPVAPRRSNRPPSRRADRRRRDGRSSGSSRAAMPSRRSTTRTSIPTSTTGSRTASSRCFYRPGQTRPAPDEWGSIAAWAWGLSRALDFLETMSEIDAKKVAVMGHSRLGKTALWAGASDQRFAVVISNNSGCGGAALSRRIFGETVGRMNTAFPHWLCANFHKYSDHEERLPIDQHELIALIAPRPVLVCSAEDDQWADPKGEFLGALGADPVYRLLGTSGLAATEMPKPARDSLVKSTIGYRIRPGKHDVTSDDWEAYMTFVDHHLRRDER